MKIMKKRRTQLISPVQQGFLFGAGVVIVALVTTLLFLGAYLFYIAFLI
jgi:hypothetical protein